MWSSWTLESDKVAIFDTGATIIMVPSQDGEELFYRILKDKTYSYADGVFLVDCGEKSGYQDV